jgi:hypothetical protein
VGHGTVLVEQDDDWTHPIAMTWRSR